MKSMITEIRGEVNLDKSKLNDINSSIDEITFKYLSGKLGYKEFKKQLHKMIKSKYEIRERLKMHIADLEEIEREMLGKNEPEEAMAKNA